VDVLGRGLVSGWVDWFPSPGKRSGAYSTGAYGVHPYQLQNFTGLWDEVSTLAHESGHSMHTYLSYEQQPYVTADYATFVAEVASTLNENLLLYQVLGRTKDKATRLFLLGSHLETLRGTLFRQTLFAEFELAIHERAERGEVLSGENLTALYLDLVRRYYGHDQGVCTVDDLYGTEWSYIHHFFYNFYVYQYATSIVASTSLASDIRAEYAAKKGTARRDAYLNMLASGSSKEPIQLLKDAGVDMTTSGPFRAAMAEMNSVMDEMEKLLASK
jgi:oligoendopeptidase F